MPQAPWTRPRHHRPDPRQAPTPEGTTEGNVRPGGSGSFQETADSAQVAPCRLFRISRVSERPVRPDRGARGNDSVGAGEAPCRQGDRRAGGVPLPPRADRCDLGEAGWCAGRGVPAARGTDHRRDGDADRAGRDLPVDRLPSVEAKSDGSRPEPVRGEPFRPVRSRSAGLRCAAPTPRRSLRLSREISWSGWRRRKGFPIFEQCCRNFERSWKSAVSELRAGRIPVEELAIARRLSKAPNEYVANTAAAAVTRELCGRGVPLRPGSKIRYLSGGRKRTGDGISRRERDTGFYAV